MDGTTAGYDATRARWAADNEAYWMAAAAGLDWHRPPSRAFFPGQGSYGLWFADGWLNTCHNALDRHVLAGRGANTALIYDSPVTATQARYTYAEMLARVEKLAGALGARGVAAVEFAILLIPLLLMLCGVAEFGRAIYQYDALTKATRGATRYLSQFSPDDAGYPAAQAKCMAVACFLVHGGVFGGEHGGEKAFLYLAGYLALLFAGSGKFAFEK
jgi:hypothetical protein